MKCEEFFVYWQQVCEENKADICKAWDNGTYSEYTDVILGRCNNESVITKLHQKIKETYEVYQEYYSCDVIFFKNEDKLKMDDIKDLVDIQNNNTPSIFNQTWVKKIAIHLEHENTLKNSWHEIMQFCVIPGDLNVLITYPNTDKDINGALHCYEKILDSKEMQVLVIFGEHTKGTLELSWKGYTWDSKDKKFKQICTNEKWSINAKVQTGHKKEHPK